MIKVLFVCATDFCLSPLAGGLLEKLLRENGLDSEIIVDSAGTHPGFTPRAPDRRVQDWALERGVDISAYRSREVTAEDVAKNDLIVVMTDDDYWFVHDLEPDIVEGKIELFLLKYADDFVLRQMPDPVLGEENFEGAFSLIEETIPKLFVALKRRYKLESA